MTEPIALANAVLPGAGYVHLTQPVPTPCRITLSPDSSHSEAVPVYLCSGDETPVAQLGYGRPDDARVVVLIRAHAAGSPVRVDAPEDTRSLPPYSGRAGACPKCGDTHAATRWLIKPRYVPSGTASAFKDLDPWYHGYLTGGNFVEVVRAARLKIDLADWWPDEWLGRYCPNCEHRWDEALAEQENADV